jgi:hypothetical protein
MELEREKSLQNSDFTRGEFKIVFGLDVIFEKTAVSCGL